MTPAWNEYDIRQPRRSCQGGRRRAERRAIQAVLRDVLDPAHLYRVTRTMTAGNGQAPGIDGVKYDDLSQSEWFQLFRDLRAAILEGTYRPQPLRAVEIAKAGGGTRTLRLAVITDRVLSKAVADALTPLAERLLLDCCYGFRPRRDRFGLMAALTVFCETHGTWVLTADDIKKAFDNVPVGKAVEALRRLEDLGADTALVSLATTLIKDHEPKEVGIPQGDAQSPLILNLLLHFALDTLMPAARGGHAPVLYLRYADNLLVATRTETEGRELLERIRSRLKEVGLELKGDPGETRNLAGKQTLNLLGLRLTSDGNRLMPEVPNHKWGDRRNEDDKSRDLRTKLKLAHHEANPTAATRQLTKGWIMAHGPASGNDPRKDEETTNRLHNLLRDTRHRDALTRDQIVRIMRTASKRWERTVAEARTRLTTELTTNPVTTPGTTAHATAVIPTIDYARMDGTTDDTIQDVTDRDGPDGTTRNESAMSSGCSSSSSPANTSRPSGRSTALPNPPEVPRAHTIERGPRVQELPAVELTDPDIVPESAPCRRGPHSAHRDDSLDAFARSAPTSGGWVNRPVTHPRPGPRPERRCS